MRFLLVPGKHENKKRIAKKIEEDEKEEERVFFFLSRCRHSLSIPLPSPGTLLFNGKMEKLGSSQKWNKGLSGIRRERRRKKKPTKLFGHVPVEKDFILFLLARVRFCRVKAITATINVENGPLITEMRRG